MPMSEQMCAAQWTKVKATVTFCNYYMTMLVGVKCAKGVILLLCLGPSPWPRSVTGGIRPHCPCKVPASTLSTSSRPGGTGLISASVARKLLLTASMDDCHTSARGCAVTPGNYIKATFDVISETCSYLTHDFWKDCIH